MKKSLLSGLTAAALVLSLAPAALAAVPPRQEAAQVLAALDVMVGSDRGDLMLERPVTRAEFTKMAVAASPARDTVGDTVAVKPYPDVPSTYWAAPYIKTAVDLHLVQGDLRGYFNPNDRITLAEGVTIVLRLLGYQDSTFTGVWPTGQMAQYRALELNEGISIGQDNPMSRQDAMYLFYNLMRTRNTSGVYHLNVLEPMLNLVGPTGQIDRVGLINSAMKGPLTAVPGWQEQVPFDLSTAAVWRDGRPSSMAEIRALDVIYWSESMRTLWVCTGRVTGTINALMPSASTPNAVVLAGRTYPIATAEAAYALSDLGSFRPGDTVTLLLGRDDAVAAVTAGSAQSSELYGVVLSEGSAEYKDGQGGTYTTRTVQVAASDGTQYTYPTTGSFQKGALVCVRSDGGKTEVKNLSARSLTGRVSSDGSSLGSRAFAEDVEILDTYKGMTPRRIYPERLAGVSLRNQMVRYYRTNDRGEITHLILDDVTGDLHGYGVVTEVSETSASLPTGPVRSSVYELDLGGKPLTFGSGNALYGLEKGPCQVKMDGPSSIERLAGLNEVPLDGVSGATATGKDGISYRLSETAAFYEVIDGDYYYSSLAHVRDGEFTLTGWYDKPGKDGGCIRVIVAK